MSLKYLGTHAALAPDQWPVAVFYLTYYSTASGGSTIAAKLYVPIGRPPASGWPESVWSHGLGDPAAELRRWPLVGDRWWRSRGELAGQWAHHGMVTLTPWLPGLGPSQPAAGYSPLSVARNTQAVADGFSALRNVEAEFSRRPELAEASGANVRLDHNRQVLRTDCISNMVLVNLASRWRTLPGCRGLKALVADDFQPSVAYSFHYLEPFIRRLPPLSAASIYCLWARLMWAAAVEAGWLHTEVLSPRAVDVFSQTIDTPAGPLPRIVALQLVPPTASELAPIVENSVVRDLGRTPTSEEVRNWVFSEQVSELMSLGRLDQILASPVYKRYYATCDPFFAETITPFNPGLPLLLVSRTGQDPVHQPGMPSFDQRFRHMTWPKVKTFRSWGWEIRLRRGERNEGTSFGGGVAQRWALAQLAGLWSQEKRETTH